MAREGFPEVHKLFHAFPDLRHVETIDATLLDGVLDYPVELLLYKSKVPTMAQAMEVKNSQDLCVAAHGATSESMMGVAAVTLTKEGTYLLCRACLGLAS